MKNKVKQEIILLCKKLNLSCNITSKDSLHSAKLKFQHKVDWHSISTYQKPSEEFIKEFQDKVNWYSISIYQKLSEEFIKEFQNKVDWCSISKYQKLSEEFIREFQHKVDWHSISRCQKLSEEFIKEFQDKVDWYNISTHQKLSEEFIREFQHKVDWYNISKSQKLSEEFIKEFQNKVDWYSISKYQKLSEEFIKEFQYKVDWNNISKYQKLSKEFIKEFKLTIPGTCGLYTPNLEKLKYIKENTSYEVIDDKFIIAYKSVREDMRSVYFPNHYLYEVGKEYKSNCDCNIDEENSFGLSAWTKEGALEYHSGGKLLEVRIDVKDLGCIVHGNNKIRCRKLTVLSTEN